MSAYKTARSPVDEPVDLSNTVQRFLISDNCTMDIFNDPAFQPLQQLAMQLFSAPCSSAASERVFSQAGLIMKPTRARLSKAMLEKLVFLKCNAKL